MINKLRNRKLNKGFTLVELLAVIGIILVLAAVAIPAISNAIQAGERASDARQLQILNSSYQNYLAAGGTLTAPGDLAGAIAKLQTTGAPSPTIGVGGPFILSAPFTVPKYPADGTALKFDGVKFLWS